MCNHGKLLKMLTMFVVLLLTATAVFASNGDTINIGGTVPLILNLTVTPDAAADNLPLTTTGADTSTTENLADITISTNNTAGWELWIFSVNGGSIDNDDTDSIAYTLTYAGTGGVATTAPSTAGVLFGQAAAATTDTAQSLDITYTQSASHPAGYYSDQLTIVLRAK